MFIFSIAITLAYLIGSFPTAYLVAKILKGIDIRNYGSGNMGATNVYRVVGKMPGIFVLIADIAKGYIPVVVLPAMLYAANVPILSKELYTICLGAAAVIGHLFSVFLKFKGGKGVATTAGVLLGIAPRELLICFFIWTVIFVFFRYVSLASIIAAISLPVAALILNDSIEIVIFFITIAFIGTYKHKSNIKRLINNEEKRIF